MNKQKLVRPKRCGRFAVLAAFLAFMTAFSAASLSLTASAAADDGRAILGGVPFGLTMYTNGVIVISVGESSDSPARRAGIRENDVITKANGCEIGSNEEFRQIVRESGGEDIELSLTRGERPLSVTVTPQADTDGGFSVGMWIRDSTAGLGTVTYFDESTASFGALGHGINDRDTGVLLPLKSGKIMNAEITSVTKAQPGVAGGLNGCMGSDVIGEITVNSGYGVFGRYERIPTGRTVDFGDDSDVSLGKAEIYCTLDDSGVQAYEVEIEKLSLDDDSGRNMVIRVTDEELLEKTGGIVQGMSGSPIVKGDKLIGAVTHVFVNSPERGYGISIGNMRECYKEFGRY